MNFDSGRLSRRTILQTLTALAGVAALPAAFTGRHAHAAMPMLPPDLGRGRSVAVAGAGMAGLTTAYVLARHGFRVTVYEADDRYGGRSLTARPEHAEYRDWWLGKYNSDRLFPSMYVSEYREDPARSPDPQPQICRFDDPRWDPQGSTDPVELFLNAGPGRIPSDHVAVLDLCKRIGVALEPYIFLSTSNLLQSDAFNGGTPLPFRQVNYSLAGQLAEMLATVVKEGHALGQYSVAYRKRVLDLLQQFGDLNGEQRYDGSSRLGYSHPPGGWRDTGVLNPVVPFDQTLNSGFAGGGGPQAKAGPVLFNANNIIWQTSLLQPVGGMDRIWQRLLMQEIPGDAVDLRTDDPRAAALAARDAATKGAKRYVGDLVVLNHRVTSLRDDPGEPQMHVGYGWTDPVTGKTGEGTAACDFCVSTMAPNLLAAVPNSLPGWFNTALSSVLQSPAIKVGWQGRTRFWELENQIYGGISWTDDPIRQVWYPSEDYGTHTGVLTGAYNSGAPAKAFGELTQEQRIQAALSGGEKLHPGFTQKVHADKGMTIAWHLMPNQVGGWAVDTANTQPEIYRAITTLPQGRLYLAGDAWSQLPGWKEGAVSSAYAAIEAIAYALQIGKAAASR